MRILIVATVNGIQNEGMRNVITHLAKYLEEEHEVAYAALKDIRSIYFLAKSCDTVIICARANAKVFLLCKFLKLFVGKLYVILVQRPQKGFKNLNNIWPLSCTYLSIYKEDIVGLRLHENCRVYEISVGIDSGKFLPRTSKERISLKNKYGFDTIRPVVLHVGHFSLGRGLEDFCQIDKARYQCVVVASGLFEDKEVVKKLQKAKVKLITEFLPNVEEMYQLADVYFFPTKTAEYVISVPLSVMEALACGTPVIAYKQLSSLAYIRTNREEAINMIIDNSEITNALEETVLYKSESTLLADTNGWDESAQEILNILKG